jgi:hypothetical protein
MSAVRKEIAMRRRKLLVMLVGLILALVGAIALLAYRTVPNSRPTRENYCSIQKGMTPEEIEVIFGPPDDCRTGPTTVDHFEARGVIRLFEEDWQWGMPPTKKRWECDTAIFEAEFGSKNTIVVAFYQKAERQPQSTLDNLLCRAKR